MIEQELQRVQSGLSAWSLVGALLQPQPPQQEQQLSDGPQRDQDMAAADEDQVRFFGAATLQAKLARQWTELDPTQYLGLRTSVLDWLADCSMRLVNRAVRAAAAAGGGAGGAGGGAGGAGAGERIVLRKLAGAVTGLSLRLHQHAQAQAQSHAHDHQSASAGEGGGWDHWLLEVVARVAAAGKVVDRDRQSVNSSTAAVAVAAAEANVLDVLGVVIEQVARADLVGSQR